MNRFFHHTFSLGTKKTAAKILYTMCDLNDKEHTDLAIQNFYAIRNNLARVLDVKMDNKTYEKLSDKAKANFREDIANQLIELCKNLDSLYNYHRCSDDRDFLTHGNGILHNQVHAKNDVLTNVSYTLPKTLFENREELEKQLTPFLHAINRKMGARLFEEERDAKKCLCFRLN